MSSRLLSWLAVAAWAIILAVVAVAVLAGKTGKLYATFVAAGDHFRQAEPLYGDVPAGQDIYRYSPLVAAALVPWTYVSPSVGEVLWRWAQAIAFLVALRAWSRVAVPAVPWPVLALLSLPLVAGNIFNGQLNPLVAALLLAGLAAFARERYGLAAGLISAAAMIKIYPIALGLLLCVVEPRRFGPRLAVAVAIGCTAPFALQSEDYVERQFAQWMQRVETDDRTEQPIYKGYHDFQKLLRCWGMPTDLSTYRVMEVAAGCAAAAFVMWGRTRGWIRHRQIQACAGVGLVWCTLFGPATESATYMLLAPIAAHAVVAVVDRAFWERVWVRWSYMLLVSVPVILWFPRPVSDPYRAFIPQAHAAVLLLFWHLRDSLLANTLTPLQRKRTFLQRNLQRIRPDNTTDSQISH
jgi:hypothetical protein